MIGKQIIKDYASREDLQGTILVEIIFGKSVCVLEEQLKAYKLYPKLVPNREAKGIIAYESLAKAIVARFHPMPNKTAPKKDLLNIELNIQEFCSWLLEKMEEHAGFHLNPAAKLFVDTVLESRVGEKIKTPAPNAPTTNAGRKASPSKNLIIDEAKKIRKEKGAISAPKMARMSRITMILAPAASHTGLEDITDDKYKKRFGCRPGTVEDWIREGFKENPSS